MEISDAYRKARRNTTIFCGISLAWAAAQFELNSLTIGAAGKVDISNASVPTILACLILFSIGRCTIEFMMQTNETRRWNLAQIDYNVTLNLLRLSLLALAASSVSRSFETVAGIALVTLALFFSYFLLVFVATMIFMPIRMFIRSLSGRVSAASSAIESVVWSMFIVALLYIFLFASFGFEFIQKIPLLNKLPPIPPQISSVIFTITAILILLSFFFEKRFLNKVFAFVPKMIERSYINEDGKKVFSIEPNPDHPEYEEFKDQSPLVYSKVESNEKSI